MPFWQLYYHVVWSTDRRLPLISPQIESQVHEIVRLVATRHGVTVHAVGGTEDHIHLVIEAPPTVMLSRVIGRIKGASSREINRQLMSDDGQTFSWQAEYGVLSFAQRQLETVCRYVANQRERHQRGQVREALERSQV
jgi:putative transposase